MLADKLGVNEMLVDNLVSNVMFHLENKILGDKAKEKRHKSANHAQHKLNPELKE